MSPITTHILDTAIGKPAAGVVATLSHLGPDGTAVEVGRGVTNSDGRIADLLTEGTAVAGTYRIEFATGDYFASSGQEAFYPRVEIEFTVSSDGGHYHVPLLLSPFGYSTYRGS